MRRPCCTAFPQILKDSEKVLEAAPETSCPTQGLSVALTMPIFVRAEHHDLDIDLFHEVYLAFYYLIPSIISLAARNSGKSVSVLLGTPSMKNSSKLLRGSCYTKTIGFSALDFD